MTGPIPGACRCLVGVDREALAIVLALKFFRHRLLGRKFTRYTDHRPLTYWLTRPPVSE